MGRSRDQLWVVWNQREAFSGEDESPVPTGWKWEAPEVKAIDTFGRDVTAKVATGRVSIDVSVTPVFVEGKE